MTPDKLLSEAEIDSAQIEMIADHILRALPFRATQKDRIKAICAQAKLAIPKPSQDAGRVEDLNAYEREFLEEDLADAKKDLADALDAEPGSHAYVFKCQTRLKALQRALSLEAKPQPDEGGLG